MIERQTCIADKPRFLWSGVLLYRCCFEIALKLESTPYMVPSTCDWYDIWGAFSLNYYFQTAPLKFVRSYCFYAAIKNASHHKKVSYHKKMYLIIEMYLSKKNASDQRNQMHLYFVYFILRVRPFRLFKAVLKNLKFTQPSTLNPASSSYFRYRRAPAYSGA